MNKKNCFVLCVVTLIIFLSAGMVFASDNVNTTDDGLLCTTSGDIGDVNEELMMEQSDINDEVASDFTDDISDVASESNNDDEILTSDNNDKEISDVESGKVLSSSNSNTLKMNNDNNKEILSSSNSEIIGMSNDNDLLQSISVSTATKTSISGTISSTFTMDYSSTLYIKVNVQGTAYEWQTVEEVVRVRILFLKTFLSLVIFLRALTRLGMLLLQVDYMIQVLLHVLFLKVLLL